jgi:hypothetical protein
MEFSVGTGIPGPSKSSELIDSVELERPSRRGACDMFEIASSPFYSIRLRHPRKHRAIGVCLEVS